MSLSGAGSSSAAPRTSSQSREAPQEPAREPPTLEAMPLAVVPPAEPPLLTASPPTSPTNDDALSGVRTEEYLNSPTGAEGIFFFF